MSVSLEYLQHCSAQTGFAIAPLEKNYLIYQSVTGHNDRVEVDLNFLFRLPGRHNGAGNVATRGTGAFNGPCRQSSGNSYPELLFSDAPEEAKRMAGHPAILWKLVNARAHLAQRKTKPTI